MNVLKNGEVVISVAGHDKNQMFLVLKSENGYIWLVDGKTRTIQKPKKKKDKHVKSLGIVDGEFAEVIKGEKPILDASVRKTIEKYQKK